MAHGAEHQPQAAGEGYELDSDTALEGLGDGRYRGEVSARWGVGAGPNGGYLAAFILRAVLAESALPDPLSLTVHYLSRPAEGPCELVVTRLREGRGHASYRADLVQSGEVRCAALATLGRLRPAGPLDFQPEAPAVPPPEECSAVRRLGEAAAIWERVEQRVARPDDVFFMRAAPGEARTGGWTRLLDGRPTDALALALFLDCWPPAVFGRTLQPDPIGAPTLEYTVHWRNGAASDWCYASFETRALTGGYVDEEGELFDEEGTLVACSRQLARYDGSGRRAAGR